jgi:hypothetical protein
VFAVIVRVEVVLPLIVAWPSETDNPAGLEAVNVTVEANPLRRLRLIVEVPWAPVLVERLDGLAKRLKSWKVNVIVVEWIRFPLAPVIVSE